MKDTIINFGKSVFLDGIRLGTASVVGEVLGNATRKVLGIKKSKKDGDDDSNERTSNAAKLSDLWGGSDND